MNGNLKFNVVPGSLLEKGLKYAQKREEELDNIKFQIQLINQNLSPDDTKSKGTIDKLLLMYNNLMYPHMELDRKNFAEDSLEKFKKLKNLHKTLKVKEVEIDKNKKLNITF